VPAGRVVESIDWVDDLAAMAATHRAICALGSTRRRAFVEHAASVGLRFVTLVHPSARVSSRSTVGEGSIVCPGAQIASHARIGRHVLVNRGALVGHNVEIADYVTVGPGANIAGFTRIGCGAHVAMGATIVDRLIVGAGSVVAAGTVVTRDVPDRVMVGGARAFIVKRDVDGL
jgi:sugar O-acyltransferase (sialic acid O-acetyltransferase NeuD family)